VTWQVRTLDPCGIGSPSSGLSTATFHILPGEQHVHVRLLVDRSTVEVFVMGGRVVFSATYNPSVLYVPDTHVALHAWGVSSANASVDVYSMGCGWTDPPYQANPTAESLASFGGR
jgi:S-adenosylmethionine/arginine decarboxylase-like enzyme